LFVRRIALAFLPLFLAATLAGCSSFQKSWEQAATDIPSSGMSGRWAGRWQSGKNKHNGELRCIVRELTNGLYSAQFHARYKIVFNMTYGYTVLLEVRPLDDGFEFEGSARLNWLAGGTYQYKGHANRTNFYSTYSCKYDHGYFQMSRPTR
jgi:hypothetical protein